MGLLWWRNKKVNDESSTDTELPDDLDNFLNKKESQLSDREFKALLKRQSKNVEEAKKAEESLQDSNNTDDGNFVNLLTGKNNNNSEENIQKKIEIENDFKMPVALSTANSMKAPKGYTNLELETYRREYDDKEVVLINCSEIQNSFYKCLANQSIWDRLSAVSKLESDDCTKLADFFVSCRDIQKKAFLTFDYTSLETIDEMKSAAKMIDEAFTKNFKDIDDVADKEKYINYTKDLRHSRENFYAKYNK